MFTVAKFVGDCRKAIETDPSHVSVADIMQRAFAEPQVILNAFGKPSAGGLTTLYRSPQLTILHVIWKPGVTLAPHNHNIWALIGIYSGSEDNTFWKRAAGSNNGRIEVARTKTLHTGDVMPLGSEIIHSVSNPGTEFCGAIHVYGGDYFAVPRSEWDLQELSEHPCDMAKVLAFFNQ